MSQEFSLRYPVIEVQGNNGSYLSGDDYSQARYLEMRGNEIAYEMTHLLEKDTIEKWKWSYTNEEKYPTYLPSKFPFSLVNGNYGIGVACTSSIPPHNLKDVCRAVIKLIDNPNSTFDDIYCPIDFPTGATIVNENQVKESLKNGCGASAIIRASIDYDEKENELIVYEMPYMTFTSNAVGSISQAIDEGLLPGIENVIDGTDFNGPKIFIKLHKGANVKKILRLLYKYTPLQNFFSINVNMLEKGVTPKLYTWKEQLETYIQVLRDIITKSYQYDLNKILGRLHILEGLIIIFNNLDEAIQIIRQSSNTESAKKNLINRFSLSESQVDYILKMKLSSLTHLEIESIQKEKEDKDKEANNIKSILSSEEKIKEKMKKDIQEIADKYGDERRTKCINLDFTDEEEPEPIEEKELLIHYTNYDNLYTQESTTLLTSRRGLKGSKVKLANDEAIIETLNITNLGSILLFTTAGKVYNLYTCDLPVNGKVNVNRLFDFEENEKINAVIPYSKDEATYFCFVTEKGFLKKTAISEYNFRRNSGIRAINLSDGDNVVSVMPIKDEKICILTDSGRAIFIDSTLVNAIGRASRGIKGIKLDDNKVISAKKIDKTDDKVLTISKNGLIKKTPMSEFSISGTNTKGKKLSEVRVNDMIVNFLTFSSDCDIIIIVNNKLLKINTKDVPELSRTATGNKAIGLDDDNYVVNVIKSIS